MPTPITLKVFRGNELVRTEQYSREIIKIGRLATAHLCLDDEKISRIHSVIEVSPDGAISIIDMGSAEGTFVNGKKVSRGALRAGDQITFGGLRIVLESGEAARSPVAAAPVNEAQNVAVSVPAPAAAPAAPAKKTNGAGARATAAPGAPVPAAPVAPTTTTTAVAASAAAIAAAPAPAPDADFEVHIATPVPVPATAPAPAQPARRSEEHTSELQSQFHLVCRLLLEKKNPLSHKRPSQQQKKKDTH